MKCNKLKGVILTIFVMLLISVAQAKYFEVLEFKEDPSDQTAKKENVRDINKKVCSALKLEANAPADATIGERIYKKTTKGGSRYLFFSTNEAALTIETPGFDTLVLVPPDHSEFFTGKVYTLRVRKMDKIELAVEVNPPDAMILLDGNEFKGQRVVPGMYVLEINKDGYETILDTVEVTKNINNFTYELLLSMVPVTIEVTPSDATVFVDDVEWEVETQVIPAGAHRVRIMKEGYEEIELTIFATSDNYYFSFDLTELIE